MSRSLQAPKIVHLIYFPWDRDQRLLPDPSDFDRAPCDRTRHYAPDFEVRLWTYDRARAFCGDFYPEIWSVLQSVPRPMMIVDVLRWLVVHHHGGIYWQYGSTPRVPMAEFLPSPGKAVKLFTEVVITPDFARQMASEPIRGGEPEERVRVRNQVFSAVARSDFVAAVLDLQLMRLKSHPVRRDYDVLFVTGPALCSTVYDRCGRTDPRVELVPPGQSERMFEVHSTGSWRTDAA